MKKFAAWLLSSTLLLSGMGGIPAMAAGSFNTNLQGLQGLQGSWSETAEGLQGIGHGNGDWFAMSSTVMRNFSYEAKVTLNGNCAASLVFRSNDNGSQAYVANVDIVRGDARLFKFPATGAFELGSYAISKSKREYTLRVEAFESTIRFYVDGELAIEATDSTYSTGKLGLLTWTADASSGAVFQDVLATELTELPPIPDDPRTRIACVGDSITYGELCNYGNMDTQSYPAQLQALLGENYKVMNFGYNGACMMKNASIPYVNQGVYRSSLASRPDIVILMLGTNDASDDAVNHGNQALIDTYYKAHTLEMIETYRNLPSKPTVYIATSATCYRTDDPSQQPTIHDKIVPLQKAAAAETGCKVIDIHEATKDRQHLFPDLLHPGYQGYGIIAGVMCAGILSEADTTPEQIALAQAYAAARQTVRRGQGIYTDESYAAFEQAVENTKAALVNIKDMTAEQITAQVAAVQTAAEQLAEAEVPEGPVLHYDFNTVEDGKVKDSVNGLDATIVGNVVKAEGFDDGAVDFKGSSGDYLLLPSNTLNLTRDITITAWVRLRRNNTWSVFMVAGDSQSDCMSFATRGDGVGLSCGFNISGKPEERVRTSTANAVKSNKWAHIVYTQSGNVAKIYLNGKEIGTQTLSIRPCDLVGGTELRLGSSHLFPSDPNLSGLMEDFAIYNQSMTIDEIKALYDSGVEKQKTVTAVTDPAGLSYAYGTAFEALALPDTVAVTLKDGTKTTATVAWNKADYDSTKSGDQTLTGTLELTAPTVNPNGLTASIVVTVGEKPLPPVIKVSGIVVRGKTMLTVGKRLTLKATVFPTNATNQAIRWSASNKNVTIDANGKVTAKQAGKVTVTVTALDGSGVKASILLTVQPKAVKIKKASGKKGKVTVKLKTVKKVKKYKAVIQNKNGKTVLTKTLKKATTTFKAKKLKKGKYTIVVTYKQNGVQSVNAEKAFKMK